MQYLYGKVDTKMNEVFEMVAEVLEELRSEAGEREYSVCTKEAKNAAKELKKANQEYEKLLAEISGEQRELLEKYMDQFTRIGFEFENFGPDSYAVCAVPDNLFSIAKKDLLMEMIDSLSDEIYTGLTPDVVDEKIASMSCKAAVKGNIKLSYAEADALIGELLALDNPYHCPHGRPTIISMSKREIEKKFKRIV